MLTEAAVIEHLNNIVEDLLLNEVKFQRVIRGGKVKKIVKPRKGFKVLRRGLKIKMKRMTFQEKRSRKLAMKAVWRKGKAGRVMKSKRKLVISLRKRNSIFGSNKVKR